MKRLLILISCFICSIQLYAQLNQFRLIGDGNWTVVNDSVFFATINFSNDLTGNYFSPINMSDTMRVFSQRGQVYSIDSIANKTYSSAKIWVVERGGDWGTPIGKVMVYDHEGREAVPNIPYGVNVTAQFQEAVSTYNARLIGTVGGDVSAQIIDTLTLQGDTMLQVSLSGDGAPVKELDLSALKSVVDSTRLTQDSILVYYQDGAEVRRDTIARVGGGGVADNLGNHIMTQNLQTNGNWISGDGGNEGIVVDANGNVGIGALPPLTTVNLSVYDASGNSIIHQESGLSSAQTLYKHIVGGADIGAWASFGSTFSSASLRNSMSFTNRTANGSIQFNRFTGGVTYNFLTATGTTDDVLIGIHTTTPSYTLDINSTNAVRLPVGTTAQRPTGANGLIRFSSTNNRLEAYYNAQWNTIASEGIEDHGSTSDTTDGSGDITVSHTLGSASITVVAAATGTTFYNVQVHTKTSATFKIRFFDATGAAVTATAVTADWIAKLQ